MKRLALALVIALGCTSSSSPAPLKLTNYSLGTVFTKTGPVQLSNGTYVFGSTFYADRGVTLRLFPEITVPAAIDAGVLADGGVVDAGAGGAAGITACKFKLQVQSGTTSIWDDVRTVDDRLGNQIVEQAVPDTGSTYAIPSASSTSGYGPLTVAPGAYSNGLRVGVKVTGVAAAGTTVTVAASVAQ